MKVGDRVRVSTSVIVYHHPKQKQKPYDLQGMEGEITAILTNWEGRPVSANLPVLVKLEAEKPFKAHFRETELDVLS